MTFFEIVMGVLRVVLFAIIVLTVLYFIGRVVNYIKAGPARRDAHKRALKAVEMLDKAKELATSLIQPAALCSVSPERVSTNPLESKIGGWPVWPKGKPLPVDDQGAPFLFIAQINFEDCPDLPDFPTTGIMQFFVQSDDLWGLDSEYDGKPGHFVIYHETTKDLIAQNPYPDSWEGDCVPFDHGYPNWRTEALSITFEKSQLPPPYDDFRLYELLGPYWRDIPDSAWEAWEQDLRAEHEKTLCNVGGHPRFVQQDVRSAEADGDKTICLFSMGSIDTVMMWGDAGEAWFLISPEDLRAKRFDKAIYGWDCG